MPPSRRPLHQRPARGPAETAARPVTLPAIDGRCRAVVEAVLPDIDGGRFPIKRTVGERVRVEAYAHADGHDVLVVMLRHRRGRDASRPWSEVPMVALGNDEWEASFEVVALGIHQYTAVAWVDHFRSWRRELEIKLRAGIDVSTELLEGAAHVTAAAERAVAHPGGASRLARNTGRARVKAGLHRQGQDEEVATADALYLREVAELLASDAEYPVRTSAALDDRLLDVMSRHADRALAFSYPRVLEVWVDRERARFGAWYEMFPRSWGPTESRSATFDEAARHLRNISALGFDVVYLPPIHPIGTTFRKGRGNALAAAPGDPGSPWAIGSSHGGHMAVDPALGTLADFESFVATARRLDMEIALDIAFQCSPDHPYVRTHPEWFKHRPDGTIKYAENPPKKYQDIYPFDFECDAWQSLWNELLGVVLFWIARGVRIFRVDNPHTKPFAFWEWLIANVRDAHPDVIFLSEAFTRPKMMGYLAKLGFTQSYSYFTWRNTKAELEDYFTELTHTDVVEYLRPNLFANTPDILHRYLQEGGPAAFRVRLILAATLGPSYGIYSGFELCEHRAVPGTEEYADSEKYQIRHWDWDRAGHIKELVAQVNRIRREHRALQFATGLTFHDTDNPALVAYSRRSPDAQSRLLVVVNLDPDHVQHGWISVPAETFAAGLSGAYDVFDLLSAQRFSWSGDSHYVRLDPSLPAHVLMVVS